MRRGLYITFGLLVFVAALTPASDTDLWWHMAAGREILGRGSFLRVDPFTLSAAGRPWIDLHWLFQLAVYGIYQGWEMTGLVVAKAAVVAAGALVLLAAVVRASAPRARQEGPGPGDPADAAAIAPPLFVVAMAAAVFFARHLILVRPVVFTLLFLALFLLLLEGFARGDNPRRLLWLPLLQVVWVNSQGLFALGPAVISCYALGGALGQRLGAPELPPRGAHRLLGIIALGFVACLITPYGVAGLLLPIKLLLRLAPGDSNVFSSNIAENVPPWLLQRSAPGQVAPFHVALALLGVSFLAARRQVVLGRALVAAAFAVLALLANRNVLLFFWMTTPIAVLNFAPALARGLAWARGRLGPGNLVARWLPHGLTGAGLLGVVALVLIARRHETPIAAPAPFRVPAAAVAHLPPAPAGGGRIFTADHYGGYVTWARFPGYRPFIDTRLVLHTGQEYQEFLGLLDNPLRWDEFQRRQNFDHALLPAAFPDRYLGLIRHLAAAPDWRLTFTDGSEVLFSHVVPGTAAKPAIDLDDVTVVDGIVADLDRRLPVDNEAGRAARRHLARLLLVLDHVDRARDVLARLPADDLDGQALHARSFLLAGDATRAAELGEGLLARAGDVPAVLDLLALTAVARGDAPAALGYLRRALAADPFDGEARALLDRLEAEQRRSMAGPPPQP